VRIISLGKCFYYILNWKWSKWGTTTPQSIAEQQLTKLKIKMLTTNKSIELQQNEVYESHKILNTYKCIVGKET
jgi:hypothetical protein